MFGTFGAVCVSIMNCKSVYTNGVLTKTIIDGQVRVDHHQVMCSKIYNLIALVCANAATL